MNSINLVGRLTHDVELKKNNEGVNYVSFSIAVNRGESVDFFNGLLFDKKAEVLADYTKKGDRIGIVGRVQTGEFLKVIKIENGKDVEVSTKTWTIIGHELHLLQDKPKETETANIPPKSNERRRY